MTRLPCFAALTLGLALAGTAMAQSQAAPGDPGTPPQHMHRPNPQQQLEHLTRHLQLSADQQSKIGPILQQRSQQFEALHGDTSLRPAERRAKAMSIMQDSQQQIDAVLTPAQRDQWKAMRERAMERMEERRGQKLPSSSGSGG